jgi:16S rRNA processing protein RimM
VTIGRLVKPHGIKGEVAVFPLTAHLERFAAGRHVFLSSTPDGEDAVPVQIESSRSHAGRVLLKLDRVESRTVAERTVGRYVLIPRAEAEDAREEGEFFLHALVGRAVVTADGRRLGEVADVLEPAGRAMLEIATPGRTRLLLPFVSEFVCEVKAEEIVVEPPEGWEEI